MADAACRYFGNLAASGEPGVALVDLSRKFSAWLRSMPECVTESAGLGIADKATGTDASYHSREKSGTDWRGHWTTLVGIALDPEGVLWLSSFGDSTGMMIRGDDVVWSSVLDGERGTLTSYLSLSGVGEGHLDQISAEVGDVLLLLSDGFVSLATEASMVESVRQGLAGEGSAQTILSAILERSDDNPHDNATCLVAKVVGE